jgi:hypothetical protein
MLISQINFYTTSNIEAAFQDVVLPLDVAIIGCLQFACAVQTRECRIFMSDFPNASQGSLVGILTTPRAGRSQVPVPAGVRVFPLFQNFHTGSGA